MVIHEMQSWECVAGIKWDGWGGRGGGDEVGMGWGWGGVVGGGQEGRRRRGREEGGAERGRWGRERKVG